MQKRKPATQSPPSECPLPGERDTYNEAQLRAILQTSVEGIITIDQQGVVESFNESAERIFGYGASEVIGKNVNILMPSPHRDQHDEYLAHYLATGEQRIIGIGREVVGRRKDGTQFPMHLSVSEVLYGDRRIFTGFVHDLTERAEYERKLRQERDFAESVIETAHAIVLVLDREGRVVRYNRFMEDVSGFPLRETVGLDWFETFLPERHWQRIRKIFSKSLRGDGAKGVVNPIVIKSGVEREISWWDTPLRDADGKVVGVLAIGHDVTDLRHAQQRLIQSERLAAIGEAMAGLAHESRNALQRLQVTAELLADLTQGDPEATNYIGVIKRAQNDLQRLFHEVKEYAAPIQLAYEQVSLDSVVNNAWSDLAAERKGRAVDFVEECRTTNLDIDLDPFAMQQVFRNILENALSACHDPVEIRVGYSEVRRNDQEALEVCICDNGPGLSAEEWQRAFDSFYTTKTKGTGLGLAISKRIVEAHDGEIAADPDCTTGAKFVVTLPRKKP